MKNSPIKKRPARIAITPRGYEYVAAQLLTREAWPAIQKAIVQQHNARTAQRRSLAARQEEARHRDPMSKEYGV